MNKPETIQVACNRVAETRKPPMLKIERCTFSALSPIQGGQGRTAPDIGHSGMMLVYLLVAVMVAACVWLW